jgi:signal transduction histidine kinase/HAMP domain-containing protein
MTPSATGSGRARPGSAAPPPRQRSWLSFQRQQTLSLLALAIVPLLVFSVLAFQQAGGVIEREADNRVVNGAVAVRSILGRDASDLQALVDSYATWNTLQADVAAWDEAEARGTVLDFQVGQGTIDAAALVAGSRAILSGPPDVAAGLRSTLDAALGAPAAGDSPPGPGFMDLAGGLYLIAAQRISLGGRTGPGVDAAAGRPAGIAFARRLDARFVVSSKRLTSTDLAIFDGRGGLLAASDQGLTGRAGLPGGARDPAAQPSVEHPVPGIAVVVTPILDRQGTRVGSVVVASDLSVLGAIGADVVPFLLASLALTLLLALAVTAYLADRLRRRLVAIRGGIAAVERGDLTIRLPEGDRDELERLAGSHNRLAAALQRRDRIIWQSRDALQSLEPDRPADRLAMDAVEAARTIFELETCRLVDESGAVVASFPVHANGAASPTVRAPLSSDTPAPVLEGKASSPGAWSAADRELFEMYAREMGVRLRDAGMFAQTAQRAERLGRINELQRDFLRGVSHNLQAPLTRILMLADDLADVRQRDALAARADAIRGDADRLARLVDQLLTLSRLDAGAYEPLSEVFALAPVARRAWEAQRSTRDLDLVDRTGGALAVADRAAIEQVFWILMDNAVKYAPAGPVHVDLGVRPRERSAAASRAGTAQELVARVSDHGPGVPADERQLVFARFQRGTTARGREGTGVGLDVARGLLETMGGRLWYEDRPGGGSTFAFTIPAETMLGPD